MKKTLLFVLLGLLLTCYTINSNAQTGNTKFGSGALASNTTGDFNAAFGNSALNKNTGGSGNTASGFEAMRFNTTGTNNTAYGANALLANQEGEFNTAVGLSSLYTNDLGNNNTAIGVNAMFSNTNGNANTAIGAVALNSNTEGVSNTAIGVGALLSNTTGNFNTALGYLANVATGNLTNATAIGNGARVGRSDAVAIGNGSVVSIGGVVGWTNFSDGRYKKDIKENVQGLAFINSLRPVTYTVNVKGLNEHYEKGSKQVTDNLSEDAKAEMKKSEDAASKIVYNGFIAQEVEAAAKKLNYEFSGVDKPQNKDGIYGLRYGDFVVPLVKAVQELANQNDKLGVMNDELKSEIRSLKSENDTQQKQIDDLKSIVQSLQQNFEKCNPCGQQSTVSSQVSENDKRQTINVSSASLEQNIPNPFNHATTINYTLPQTYSSAKILITDKSGKTLKEVNISGSGKGSLTLDASTLANGAYNYSLYVEGKLIDTKHMVLAK